MHRKGLGIVHDMSGRFVSDAIIEVGVVLYNTAEKSFDGRRLFEEE